MFVYIKIVEYLNNVIVTQSYIPLLRLHVVLLCKTLL